MLEAPAGLEDRASVWAKAEVSAGLSWTGTEVGHGHSINQREAAGTNCDTAGECRFVGSAAGGDPVRQTEGCRAGYVCTRVYVQ